MHLSNVKIYVFNRLENYYLPNFLDLVAINNIDRTSNNFLVSYWENHFRILLLIHWVLDELYFSILELQ